MNISYIPSEMGGDPLSNIASPPRLEERERKDMTTDELLKALEKALPDTYFEVTDSGYKNLVVVNFTVEDES